MGDERYGQELLRAAGRAQPHAIDGTETEASPGGGVPASLPVAGSVQRERAAPRGGGQGVRGAGSAGRWPPGFIGSEGGGVCGRGAEEAVLFPVPSPIPPCECGAGGGGVAMASMAAAIAASRTAVMNGNRPLDERERKRFSYFSSLSPMARKIMAEKERIRERYGPEWERLPPRQQDEIIDKCLVEPHVQARYAAHRGTTRPPAQPASYPSLRLNTGQKVVRFGDEVPAAREGKGEGAPAVRAEAALPSPGTGGSRRPPPPRAAVPPGWAALGWPGSRALPAVGSRASCPGDELGSFPRCPAMREGGMFTARKGREGAGSDSAEVGFAERLGRSQFPRRRGMALDIVSC